MSEPSFAILICGQVIPGYKNDGLEETLYRNGIPHLLLKLEDEVVYYGKKTSTFKICFPDAQYVYQQMTNDEKSELIENMHQIRLQHTQKFNAISIGMEYP